MTPLAKHLIRRIAATGPITIAEYMQECLLHPEHGYYTTRDPLGTAGDFTTAPEISQMFGELLGLALAQAWLDQGAPKKCTLAELGPGRGPLMADALRATRGVPGFHDAAEIWLVEASPVLRRVQQETLGGNATWIDSTAELPDLPLFLVANEFFDALPVRQFTRADNGWREHVVGLQDGAPRKGLAASLPIAALDHRLGDTTPGDVVETCAPAKPVMAEIALRIRARGGAAIIIDYGDWRSQGDTLQAVSAHEFTDPLAAPGQTDLTAHVDFEALAQAAGGLSHSRMTPQGVFLERLGITQRAETLGKNLSGAPLDAHIAAHRRLTHPEEMGTIFKVLGLTQDDAPPLAGFDT